MKRDQHIWRTTELDHRACKKVSRGHKGYGLVLLCCENNEHHEFSTSDETTSCWFKCENSDRCQ